MDTHVLTILNLVADADIALAISPLSTHDAKKGGIKKIIVTNVEFDIVKMGLKTMFN